MTNTELRQIRHVVVLGAHLSFTHAAKELGITQSALTRSIQAIEERARARLFDRDRGRVSLTETGKAYLERAAALLRDADDLDRLLQQSAAGEAGEVHFGMTSAIARALLPDILVQELHDRPRLREMVQLGTPKALLAGVGSETLEFCICGEQPAPPPGLRTAIIGTMPLALLVRAGHPAPASEVTLDLAGYPLLLSGQPTDAERIADLMRPIILAPPSIIVDDLGILTHLALHSDAVWMTARPTMVPALLSGIMRELPLPPDLNVQFRVVMYSHERRTLSPAARRLADTMRAQAARWAAG